MVVLIHSVPCMLTTVSYTQFVLKIVGKQNRYCYVIPFECLGDNPCCCILNLLQSFQKVISR